ncbi:MAG: VanZ family protein [Gammaproteobacteria bacterium]|nr:VanZ family protein [Gammaproteobacteria bacterium]
MLVKAFPDLRLRSLWLVIGYALVALVVFLSLTSDPVDTGLHFPYEDKVYHAFAYFTLMVWFAQIYHGKSQRYMIAAILISMGFAFEFLQSFNPNRYAELGDMVANVSGVILGFSITLTSVKNTLLKIEDMIL